MPRTASRPSEWTSIGRDLLVSLAGVPRGQWSTHLADHLRAAIRQGALRPGVQLPSSRSLAADLGLSRGVVVGVYEQLRAEGYLDARAGSATRVAAAPAIGRATSGLPVTGRGWPRPASGGHEPNPGLPDLSLFPRATWLRSYKWALDHVTDADLRYGDPQGYEPLRRELADYLGRVRGVQADAAQVVVVSGFAQGLALLARVLPARGIDSVAVEEPGSTGAREQLADWGLATPPVAVDQRGMLVDAVAASGARAVLVTPAHQYPLGVALSPERRLELLAWATGTTGDVPLDSRRDGCRNSRPDGHRDGHRDSRRDSRRDGRRYVIEDDYDAEFRYDHAPVGSLQPLAPDHVVTGSSVSKTLAPALRLGWLVLPPDLVDAVVAAKFSFDLASPTLPQAAFAHLLSTGGFDRHLRRARRAYRQRRRRLAARLAEAVPVDALSGLEAGLNVCIRFPPGVDDGPVTERLRARGVRCRPLSYYHQGPPAPGGLVVDLASATDAVADRLVAQLRPLYRRRRD